MSSTLVELQNKRVDTAVSVTKGVLGAVPFAGGLFAEIIGSTVPNQRLDRITAFIAELDKRLDKIEVEGLNKNKFALDLFEDGLSQSVRVLSKQRNIYLASFLKSVVDVNSDSYGTKKKLLNTLQELTDRDIDILFSISKIGFQATAREYYSDYLTIGAHEKLSEDEKNDYSHKQVSFGMHIATLSKLNLVYIKDKEPDPELHDSHIDYKTGLPEVEDCNLTKIGELLLASIT